MSKHTHFNLKKYNSWRLESFGHNVILPENYNELKQWIQENKTLGLWLGLGSNVLLPYTVETPIVITQKTLKSFKSLEHQKIYAQCGASCAQVSKLCCQLGYEDAAFLAGIPGTIGGALAMNAGAFGGETWKNIIGVDVINEQGHIYHLRKDQFHASYRSLKSIYNIRFLAAYFQFSKGCSERASNHLKGCIAKRNNTQPIGTFNCGSVFKNPYPEYAAKLIESCGLKGKRINHAAVSNLHANFILNEGNASYEDMISLIKDIQDTVYSQKNILLDTEVIII